MSERPGPARRSGSRGRVAAWGALLLVLVAPAALLFAWSRPMRVPPNEMPPLSLSPSAVEAQLEQDAQAAEAAPTGDAAEERRAVYHETNEAEHRRLDTRADANRRQARLRRAAEAVAELGPDALAQTRAADLVQLEPALRGTLEDDEAIGVLGSFRQTLQRYQMMVGDQQAAPQFVIRSVFKARWNSMHGRELTEGLSPVELHAYYGWLGLRAESAHLQLRLTALGELEAAGGRSGAEARGLLLYAADERARAAGAFEEAFAETPTFRLRNNLIAARN